MTIAPKGQDWSIGTLYDLKELKTFLEEHYMGLVYTESLLKWYVTNGSVLLFCRDQATGYISGSLLAVHQPVWVEGKVIDCFVVNMLCLAHQLRKHNVSRLFFAELKEQLTIRHDHFLVLFNSMKELGTPLCVASHHDRYVSLDAMAKHGAAPTVLNKAHLKLLRRKYDCERPAFMRPDVIQKLTPEDLPQVLELLNSREGSFRPHYDEETVRRLLPVDGVVNTWVHRVDGKVTDLVSYYVLEFSVKRQDKKLVGKKAFLYEMVSKRFSKRELLQVVTHSANVDQCMTFGVVGVNGMDEVAEEAKMIRIPYKLNYYLMSHGVDTDLAQVGLDVENHLVPTGRTRQLRPVEMLYTPCG